LIILCKIQNELFQDELFQDEPDEPIADKLDLPLSDFLEEGCDCFSLDHFCDCDNPGDSENMANNSQSELDRELDEIEKERLQQLKKK
jgi:hypothetical protein